jgi:fibronectin type 3 domain-containing protein
MTLNPGQTAILNVQFTPTAAGSFSGQITIASNASGGNIAIALSGTGYGHKVQLNWNAASSGGVVGYNVYRTVSGSTGYQRVNSAAVSAATFMDGNVQSGSSYVYYVTSLDGAGLESVPSNTTAVMIPKP